MNTGDIRKVFSQDEQWYRKIWTLDIQEMAWTEQTKAQVDFLWQVLGLRGGERVLDLACGFGRHALELAARGCRVTGVDITPAYIQAAQNEARARGLDADFVCADLRDFSPAPEFDAVLNLADGAIGYLEDDAENLKIFDRVAAALKPGGKHLMDVCSADYAARHFPRRAWLLGSQGLSLADFEWDAQRSRMYYAGLEFKYGEPLVRPEEMHANPTRLYGLAELGEIFAARGMRLLAAYADFDAALRASEDTFQIQVVSQKE